MPKQGHERGDSFDAYNLVPRPDCTINRVPIRITSGINGVCDVKMTENYQVEHGDEAVVYMKVKAGLKA